MTEGRPHSTSSAWRERLVALRNVPPVLGILWESGRAVVTWGILLRIIVAALPVLIAKIAAYILDDVQRVFSHQGLAPNFWWLVGIETGLNVVNGLLLRGIDYSDSLLADRYTHFVSVRVMRQAAQLDLTTYDGLMKGTKHGPMVIPGDPDSSNLMWLLDWRATRRQAERILEPRCDQAGQPQPPDRRRPAPSWSMPGPSRPGFAAATRTRP